MRNLDNKFDKKVSIHTLQVTSDKNIEFIASSTIVFINVLTLQINYLLDYLDEMATVVDLYMNIDIFWCMNHNLIISNKHLRIKHMK
jgi:hypothetical protein